MTEKDCRQKGSAPDSVGMGWYNMDSHNVQRYVDQSVRLRTKATCRFRPADRT